MKKFGILALVLVFTMMLSVVSFAADPAFKIDTDRDAENYNTEVTTVKPGSNSIAVTTSATNDAYYGVLLVKGAALPTVDSEILYIDQVTAKDGSATFTVLPIIPEADLAKDLTLYISSNASGAKLIKVPVAYGAEAETPVTPTYVLGDVDQNGEVAALKDAIEIINYQNFEPSVFDNYTEEVAAAVADVDQNGEAAALKDAIEIINYQNFEPSVFD